MISVWTCQVTDCVRHDFTCDLFKRLYMEDGGGDAGDQGCSTFLLSDSQVMSESTSAGETEQRGVTALESFLFD